MDYELYEQYWIWLSAVAGMTPKKFYHLISLTGDARAVWDEPQSVKDALDDKTYQALLSARNERTFYQLFANLEKSGAAAVTRLGDLYPARLNTIFDPPPTLYVRGNIDLNFDKAVSIVGTRVPSMDGKRAASDFSETLASEGAVIVSGLARGIDTCAHKACLKAGGRTVAVLGSGLNCIYPSENTNLANEIVDNGGAVVSEMQLDDGPQKWSFPARNRIISGLAPCVLIVEGKKNSGAMITASDAVDQSREVYAIPGSIYSPLAEGPNILIQNGAFPAVSPWDIIEAQRWGNRPSENTKKKANAELSHEEEKIVKSIKNQALTFDEIANQTGFSASILNSHLTMLILRGIIVKAPGNLYRAY
ncbi:MAG: DNA-processing protein DprA [Clostridia bacterium]|nr:DNA-processing protein DprA [Clostridia bacterium]